MQQGNSFTILLPYPIFVTFVQAFPWQPDEIWKLKPVQETLQADLNPQQASPHLHPALALMRGRAAHGNVKSEVPQGLAWSQLIIIIILSCCCSKGKSQPHKAYHNLAWTFRQNCKMSIILAWRQCIIHVLLIHLINESIHPVDVNEEKCFQTLKQRTVQNPQGTVCLKCIWKMRLDDGLDDRHGGWKKSNVANRVLNNPEWQTLLTMHETT